MATEKQLAANRRNAAKSTGPKSEAGKAVVRFNALQHGLTADIPLLPDEDRQQLDALRIGIVQALNPQGSLEENLTERIVLLSWRLQRLSRIETGLFLRLFYEEILEREQSKAMMAEVDAGLVRAFPGAGASQKLTEAKQQVDSELATMGAAYRKDTQQSDALSKLLRYETTLEKSLFRALHELQRLQAQRNGAPVLAPVAVDVNLSTE